MQAKILSKYDEIDLSAYNLEATWTVADGNGKVPSPKSPFSHDGKTVISWTLPMERGTYSIKADIVDEDGDVLIGSPMKFETKAVESFENYELVITNVRPDYSKLSAVKTLKPFDALSVPNRLREMIRLKYKGEYVKVGEYALEAESYYFKLDDYPVEAQDRYVGKYYISISDRTNNRTVKFPVDLTLNNKIYNSMVGRSIKVGSQGWQGTIVLNEDMSYGFTYPNGKKGESGTYTFNHGHNHGHNYVEQCGIDKRIIGYAYFEKGVPLTSFNYILVYEDGSISANSYYACPEYKIYGTVE